MRKIYCFDKSLHERFTEYTDILVSPDKTLSASQVELEWVCDTEIVIEPAGWQALWNVPLFVCAQNQVHYPLVVLVEVLSVDCATLSALVKVIWDEMDKYLTFPSECKVKLIELFPTIEQVDTTLDIEGTAHLIDKLRFFYIHLWLPWDNEEDDSVDWVRQHLESRLRFAYDIRRGFIDKQTCDLIRSLIREARHIWEEMSKLENIITEEDKRIDQPQTTTMEYMNLHLRLQQIKAEMDILENDKVREIVVKHHNLVDKNFKSEDEKITCYLVWLNGTLKELQEICDRIQEILPNEPFIKISGCLDDVLNTRKRCNLVMLGKGKHIINGAGELETGGIIRGMYDPRDIILCPKKFSSASTLLDFSDNSAEVVLENICLNLEELPIGIIVRSGSVRIKHCIISNMTLKAKIVQTGIVVMPNAKLIIEDTHLEFLGTAILICGNGSVIMNNCEIRSCYMGVQLSDNSNLTATKCVFDICYEHAIQMETDRNISDGERYFRFNEQPNDILEIELNECCCTRLDFEDIALKSKRITPVAEWLNVNPKI